MCRTALGGEDDAATGGKLVTVVTSDLKGSTALGERLDPESLREVLNRYFAVMRVVFESHGGRIEKIIGDAIVAVFGLPFRRDDDSIRAVEAASESQRALATLNEELARVWGVELVNRTGLATGIVHFGRDAQGQHVLIGDPMDESTAMEQNAPPQEVLLAASAYANVRDVVAVTDMGSKSPKGSDLLIQSYQLDSVLGRAEESDTAPPDPTPGMRACQVCGEESPAEFRYCNGCGATATHSEVRDSRKTVTVVFANPKPRTESGSPLDPSAFTEVMTTYFDAMKTALERHGGTVEKFIGDAVMAVFGLPVRHEDDALRAVRAASDMQAALPALNESFGERFGVRLLNHIGVNTGEVIATGDASTGQRLVTGDTVNTAARLEQAAGPAEIILGELTHRLTRDQVEVEVIAPLALKGKAEPVPAYRLVMVRDAPIHRTTQSTTFVGRETEMARLSDALFGAVDQKHPRLVTVVGDAGVGKSRLIREFAVSTKHEAKLIRGRCLPYGDGITFWPIAEAVRDAASIASDDSPAAAIARIGQLLGPADTGHDDPAAIVDRVAALMGLSASQFPVAELTWGARRLLEAVSVGLPLLVVIDDIQYAEATFLEFLDQVLQTTAAAPILVLCTARHDLLERHPDWSAAHAAGAITLQPLTGAQTGQLLDELLGDLEPSIRERIARSADGNPLYAEQIVSMLRETGAITRDGDRWRSTREGADLAIPPTVQALVASRLDALPADERAVIEPASVIGMSFADEAIVHLVDETVRPNVENELGSLMTKQLVRRASGEEVLYRFGHVVIRDTAYGGLLKRLRANLHERFVAWAERVNRERGRETEFEEILGYHLEQAYRYRGELGPLDEDGRAVGERAAAKLGSAGRRAFARGDIPAAVNLLRRAANTLDAEDPVRVELVVDLGEALTTQGRYEEAGVILSEARGTATALGDERLAARVAVVDLFLDVFTSASGRTTSQAIGEAQALAEVFERSGDHAGLARAWRLIMNNEFTLGNLSAAAVAADKVVEHGTAANDQRLVARSASAVAYALVHGPTPVPAAIARAEELIAGVRGDRKNEAIVSSALAVLRAMDLDFEAARDHYRRGRATLLELGGGADASSTSIDASRVELLADDLAAAEALLREDDQALAAIDERYFRSTVGAILANVLADRGDIGGAHDHSTVAEQMADEDDSWSQIAWRTARAKALAARGEADAAAELSADAVSRAKSTEDVVLLADALFAQSAVLRALGRMSESRPPLMEALRLYQAKGDRASAARAERTITDVEAAPAG